MAQSRCCICNEIPHAAMRVQCSNNDCHLYVCGTSAERGCCVHEFASSFISAEWNQTLLRVEFGDCPRRGCGGKIIRGGFVEAEQHLREIWDLSERQCDWFGAVLGMVPVCAITGNHLYLDHHVGIHADPTIPNPNRIGVPSQDLDSSVTD